MAIDPICGMQVDERTGLKADRGGTTFFFCCEHCRRKFLGLAPSRADSSRARKAYFCPMCEGVESDDSGVCPKCGMALEHAAASGPGDDSLELREMTRRLVAAVLLGLPVVALAMSHLLPGPHRASLSHSGWIQLALSLPAVFWAGWPLIQRGAQSFRTGHLNMFSLIALGVVAAFVYSAAAVAVPGAFPPSYRAHGVLPLYFEAAVMITALVLLGQVLELRARHRTGHAIRSLLALTPKTARLVRDGSETEMSLADVHPGDLLRVLPGSSIPVDGVVTEGSSFVDESMISGEPLPVRKQKGSDVTGGTLNGTGSFLMRADRVGRDTRLAQIIQLVADAQRSRAPIQRLADRVASVFVPIVISVSAVTFAAWALFGPEPRMVYALLNAVSVLIVACPCALGLATPMSVMVGIGRGAQAGILIRNAEAIERLARVDTVVIDKTGTLTEGKPRLTASVPLAPYTERELLRIAASLEQRSEHPIALAIVASAQDEGLRLAEPEAFEALPGYGIAGRVDGHALRLGHRAHLLSDGTGHLDVLSTLEERLQNDGQTTVHVSVDRRFAGLLGVSDPIKSTTPPAIDRLKSMRLRLIILTGDHRRTAEAVARRLGVDDVRAETRPADKNRVIAELRRSGRVVAMAGDGINDAPALAEADVGIAMATGTDIAMQSAAVTLVHGDLRGLARAIRLARAVMRNVRQNLFFAFLYNSIGIPVAAGLLYPLFGILLSPVLAGAAMSFSSVSVITNALRLRKVPLDP